MEATPENSAAKVKGLEIDKSSTPSTPAKPGSAEAQSIYPEKQEPQSLQANWSQQSLPYEGNALDGWGKGGKSIKFQQEIEVHDVATCCGESNSATLARYSGDSEATSAAESQLQEDALRIYHEFSLENADKWSNVSFQELIALANAAGTAKAAEETSKTTALIAESMLCGIQFTQLHAKSTSSSIENQGLESSNQNIPETPNRGSAISSRLCFDLNTPPGTTADASIARISCQFAPVTPDLSKRTDREKMFDSATAKEITIQNEVTMMAESDELQNNQSELVENKSSATISIVIEENFNLETGSNQQTDMSKTPQQKPRRRKHRPKVVVEGQPKRTRNQRTPKPAGDEEIATPKRKYVRKNIVSKPVDTQLEAKTSGTDVEVKPPSSEELPKTKRKYVRRQGVGQSTTPSEEGHTSRTGSKPIRVTRSSCKKSLNFDFESKVPDERSTQPPVDVDANSHLQVSIPQDQSRSTMKLVQDKEAIIEKSEVYSGYDLMQTMNHEFEQYLLDKERQASGNSNFTSNEQHDELVVGNQNERIIGKCQIVFSDVTHDKETSTFRTMTRSSSNSNCSSRTCLPRETQSRGSKRQQSSTTDELESCRINVTGAHYNSLQAYQELFPPHGYNSERTPSMHFPAIFKKKRTENLQKLATSSILPTSSTTDYDRDSLYPSNDPHRKVFTSGTHLGIFTTHCNASSNPTAAAADGTQHEQNTLMCLPNLGSAERSTKKRSKCPTRVRNFASLHKICRQFPTSSKGKSTSKDIQGPPTCMDALVANTHARLTTKKRSKRNSVASTFPYAYNHLQFATMPVGPPSLMWNNKSPIDAIIEQFNCLDIEREHNKFANQEQNELVMYQVDYPWHNTMVVYQQNGAVIPFDSSFTQIRKRRPRPKVDLDDETNRVWKLLLEDINNDGIDGTDQEKAQWWEDEREVFRGRANSFIARMHLVQGDRRFTPWKGSVVDSVIGVFLTQNVSDHLSSSAYMSMAARFPLKSGSHQNDTQSCNRRTTEVPEVLNPDDTIEWHKVSSQLSSLQDSMTLCDKKYNVEVINTRDFSGNTPEGIKATKYSRSPSSDSSECSPKLYNELDVNRLNSQHNEILASFNRYQRELDDVISSQNSVISPHDSVDSIDQTANKAESYSQSSSEAEPADGSCGSFVKLLQMAGTTMLHGVYNEGSRKRSSGINMATKSESMACNSQSVNSGYEELRDADPSEDSRFCDICKDNEVSVTEQSGLSAESSAVASCQNIIAIGFEEVRKLSSENSNSPNNHRSLVEDQETELVSKVQKPENNRRVEQVSNTPSSSECTLDVSGRTHIKRNQKTVETNLADCHNLVETVDEMRPSTSKVKRGRNGKEKKDEVDWDSLRIQTLSGGIKRERTANTMDSVDWEAVRRADVEEIAHTIKERGMNNMLAERIKDFLNRLVRDHGNIDLEWLRDVPPDRAKEYLLSVRGLGLKSVECVRLLTLHHLAFPVDTNVGRIAVRLGWVPLQPLPESLQLHLLELYPVLESIQKFLWPRLCKLDQRTLYELHYQMITFGKVFCTKSKPNCNSCPMRGECRHFASAFASARLALPAPEEKSIISATVNKTTNRNPAANINHLKLPPSEARQQLEDGSQGGIYGPIIEEPATPEPIIEEPASPEPQRAEIPEMDIEDTFHDVDEIPTIKLNIEELNQNLQNYIQKNVALTTESEMSKALVVLTPEAASIPTTKLKNINRLRTEHHVYELPDAHPLLEGFDRREPDDPSSYLLAIWTPGETVNSIQPPERRCSFQESGKLCDQETCFSCNSIREANSQTVRGTLLIPCRTAMRGSFPLNGTYFQVNEVFADHESSLNPIDVPRHWLWNLRRRTVYFGTSIPTIFKGLSQGEIQYCFWRGFVCVRGFDRKTRAPRPLVARLHFPASKLTRTTGRTDES